MNYIILFVLFLVLLVLTIKFSIRIGLKNSKFTQPIKVDINLLDISHNGKVRSALHQRQWDSEKETFKIAKDMNSLETRELSPKLKKTLGINN